MDIRQISRDKIAESLKLQDLGDSADKSKATPEAEFAEENLQNPELLAGEIEKAIFRSCNEETHNDYRHRIRTRILNIKTNHDLRNRILSGRLSASQFADMSNEKMASKERSEKDKELLTHEFEQRLRQPDELENISRVRETDGRVRSKWGMERSHAAVD